MSSGTRLERTRTFSRTSRANGSAYGYTGSYRNRLASNATTSLGARKGSVISSLRRRRGSNFESTGDPSGERGDLNFAQRLLMANENAVTNIADLWVAAAMNVDNEDPFESDTELDSDGENELLDLGETVSREDGDIDLSGVPTPTGRGRQASRPSDPNTNDSPIPRLSLSHRPSNTGSSFRPHTHFSSPHRPTSTQRFPSHGASVSFSQNVEGPPPLRRVSSSVPSIFAHSGVKTPSAVIDAQQLLARSELESAPVDPLAPIAESRHPSEQDPQPDVEAQSDKQPSLTSQIPILIIIQYGMLALHTTTHDQVFMSYLVS